MNEITAIEGLAFDPGALQGETVARKASGTDAKAASRMRLAGILCTIMSLACYSAAGAAFLGVVSGYGFFPMIIVAFAVTALGFVFAGTGMAVMSRADRDELDAIGER